MTPAFEDGPAFVRGEARLGAPREGHLGRSARIALRTAPATAVQPAVANFPVALSRSGPAQAFFGVVMLALRSERTGDSTVRSCGLGGLGQHRGYARGGARPHPAIELSL